MTTATDWTGSVGDVWAAEWRRTDRSLADLARHLDAAIRAAAPSGSFRALDIGCGAGATSLALAAARPDAEIVGIDLSEPLVRVARERFASLSSTLEARTGVRAADVAEPRPALEPSAEATPALAKPPPVLRRRPEPRVTDDTGSDPRLPPARKHNGRVGRATFLLGDVLALTTDQAPFDLVYSRHGVMFFADPVAAFARLRTAAAPGAHLVFSCFRTWSENTFASDIVDALGGAPPAPGPGPFAFADRAHVTAILGAAGWQSARATAVDFTYRAGQGADPVADAVSFLQRIGLAAARIRGAAPDDRADLIASLTTLVERRRSGDAIDFPAAAWIWSAHA